jgi:hypothetical protein
MIQQQIWKKGNTNSRVTCMRVSLSDRLVGKTWDRGHRQQETSDRIKKYGSLCCSNPVSDVSFIILFTTGSRGSRCQSLSWHWQRAVSLLVILHPKKWREEENIIPSSAVDTPAWKADDDVVGTRLSLSFWCMNDADYCLSNRSDTKQHVQV